MVNVNRESNDNSGRETMEKRISLPHIITISSLFKEGESVLEGGKEHLSYLWVIPWLISEDEAKWGLLHRQMSGRVVHEFHHWNEFRPLIRLSLAEHPKIHFYLLINSFHFSICFIPKDAS